MEETETEETGGEMGKTEMDRALEEVAKVIGIAKLNENELMAKSQVFSFAPTLMGGDIRLMEVPPHLAASLCSGDLLTLRGEGGDGAVLCTQDRTYTVREAETSNSLLVVPHLSLPGECGGGRRLGESTVQGVFHEYLEVLPHQPSTKRLLTLLQEHPLGETGIKDGLPGHTLSQLLDRVQASEEEILEGLRRCEGVRVGGEWYLLDHQFHMKILGFIFKYFESSSWELGCVRRGETVEELGELVPRDLTRQVFDLYCSPMEGGEEEEFAVDRERVSRFFGHFLLASGVGSATRYSLEDFQAMWAKAVPDGIPTHLSHLDGLILVDAAKDPPVIRPFSEASLPEGVQDRLAKLFQARERWTLADITPFIAPLATPKLSTLALLTKYARGLNVGGTKYFCAKHGK